MTEKQVYTKIVLKDLFSIHEYFSYINNNKKTKKGKNNN